jgi:hypothetical protein
MTMLKKCDARNRLVANHIDIRDSSNPVSKARRADSSKIRPVRSRASRLSFADDFMMEHSRPGPHISSIEISGSF